MENLRLRIGLAIAGILLCLVWLVPNFMDKDSTKMWWPTHKRINYGLDIQGGLHLVMGVDVPGVVSESTTRLANVLKTELATQVPGINAVPTKADNGEMDISFQNGADKAKVTA